METNTEVTDFEDLVANHIRREGYDVVISAGNDELWIATHRIENLESSDFIFAVSAQLALET